MISWLRSAMLNSIAMAWSSALTQAEHRCQRGLRATICGAPTKVRVPARQQALALSTDRYRSRVTFCAAARSTGINPRKHLLHNLRAAVCSAAAPIAIHSDNGVSRTSQNTLFNLS
jgi:hypothetical protein